MPRYCVLCHPSGNICDFCRFATHNRPGVDQRNVHDTVCEKTGNVMDLGHSCNDFECFEGEKNGWADEVQAKELRA